MEPSKTVKTLAFGRYHCLYAPSRTVLVILSLIVDILTVEAAVIRYTQMNKGISGNISYTRNAGIDPKPIEVGRAPMKKCPCQRPASTAAAWYCQFNVRSSAGKDVCQLFTSPRRYLTVSVQSSSSVSSTCVVRRNLILAGSYSWLSPLPITMAMIMMTKAEKLRNVIGNRNPTCAGTADQPSTM